VAGAGAGPRNTSGVTSSAPVGSAWSFETYAATVRGPRLGLELGSARPVVILNVEPGSECAAAGVTRGSALVSVAGADVTQLAHDQIRPDALPAMTTRPLQLVLRRPTRAEAAAAAGIGVQVAADPPMAAAVGAPPPYDTGSPAAPGASVSDTLESNPLAGDVDSADADRQATLRLSRLPGAPKVDTGMGAGAGAGAGSGAGAGENGDGDVDSLEARLRALRGNG